MAISSGEKQPVSQKAGLFESNRDGLQLDDYDYALPEALIARYPLEGRDQSRMLVLDRVSGDISHRLFSELPEFLQPDDLLVLNNTKVLPARLYGNRQGLTGRVEILMLNPTGVGGNVWTALMKPAKKLKPGTIVELPDTQAFISMIEVGERGSCTIEVHPEEFGDVPTLLEKIGLMPIPPYLRRNPEESDKDRYQTVFSKIPGAQAAPTAGLHFTPQILERIRNQGTNISEVTLAVSSGTFRTVEEEDITRHKMDPEYYELSPDTAQTIQATRASGGRVIAVGTTVAKTLESVAAKHGHMEADADWSRLFIYPGFKYQVTDALLTNFHLPKSTLLMLISAFASRELVAKAYRAALDEQYRFFSYGDCMLIL